MRQAVTFRLESELLAAAKRCAAEENRTLTNFLETLLKRHVAERRVPAAQERRGGEARRHA